MSRRIDGLRVIALFKFGKVLLLMAVIYGAYRFLNPDLAANMQRWSETLTDGFERRMVLRLIHWIDGFSRGNVDGMLLVSGGYGLLALIEGFGLWFHKRWAEWVVVISSSLLVPFELWKLIHAHGTHRELLLLVLLANIAIVSYLYRELHRKQAR